jgi:hypothetical protein
MCHFFKFFCLLESRNPAQALSVKIKILKKKVLFSSNVFVQNLKFDFDQNFEKNPLLNPDSGEGVSVLKRKLKNTLTRGYVIENATNGGFLCGESIARIPEH